MTRLKLPRNVRFLAKAIQDNEALYQLLRDTGTQLGGGTVLAVRWNNHRVSTDLDLMISTDAFDRHREHLLALLDAIPCKELTEKSTTITIKNVLNREGDIDLVSNRLGERLTEQTPHDPGINEPPDTIMGLPAEPTALILGKKFDRLKLRTPERDLYDILYAAYHDRAPLLHAINHYVPENDLKDIADRIRLVGPDSLFGNEGKRVEKPAIPEWKEALPDVFATIMQFRDAPEAQLPQLRYIRRTRFRLGRNL